MTRRRTAKSLGEMGLTLLAIGGGVLFVLTFLGNSPLTRLFEALRPWGWLSVSLGAFILGLHALRSRPEQGLTWARVEPGFGRHPSVPARSGDPSKGVLIDEDMRDRWRPPERASDTPTRPTVWSQAVFELIEWRRFEALCEALLQHEAHITASQTFGADGGIDVRLYGDSARTQLTGIVQCKHWSGKKVGEVQIREFLGLKTDHQVGTAIYITSSTFLPAAQELASRHGIVLLDAPGLLRRIQSQPVEVQQRLLEVATEGEFWRATCANCGAKMVQKTNSNGTRYWSCGRCRHTMSARQNEGAL